MKLLCIGDVTGSNALLLLKKQLPQLKKNMGTDVCIVNGENADASGRGLTESIAWELFSYGADIITAGNHALSHAKPSLYEENEAVLCPANHYYIKPEHGTYLYDLGRARLCMINLAGVAFLEDAKNPFDLFDELYAKAGTPFVLVEFHAESTAEKYAFAYYADGRASAVYGTHTHVQTNDPQILPKGTGFLCDLGMTGPTHSVIGVKPELAIQKQKFQMPVRFEVAGGPCQIQGCLFELDDKTGRCVAVTPFKQD